MNNKDNQNKAKLVPNSKINEIFDEKENSNGNFLNDSELNFSYNYRGFKKISSWWILLIILFMISIPISLIYLFYIVIKSILGFIF